MKASTAFAATLIGVCALALSAQAAPPEGKGQGNSANSHGNAGNNGKGNPGKDNSNAGNAAKGGPDHYNKGSQGNQGNKVMSARDSGHHYDDRGRDYDYFDDHRDSHGHVRGDAFVDLVYAGITAALAHEYALDYGLLGGYQALPPGIRKNLTRGKPLPPGIAKKMVPGSLLARLPSYPGYEWRIAGTDLILISIATAVVADVLYDVF